MPTFEWVGRDPSGRLVKDTIRAASEDEAREILARKGISAQSIKQKSLLQMEIKLSFMERITLRDLAIFARQMASMLDAGISVVEALAIYAEQVEKEKFKKIVNEMRADVEGGKQFWEAMDRHRGVFGPLFVSLIRAGEESGNLPKTMQSISLYFEKMEKLIGKIKSAMAYPILVLIVAIAVVIGLMTFVVPRFVKIFEEAGQADRLPAITKAVMAVSAFMTSKGMIVLIAAVIATVFVFLRFIRTARGRALWHRFLLRLPVIGDLVLKSSIARFTRTLSMLISGGVDLLHALEITAESSGNVVIGNALKETRKIVEEGRPLSSGLKKYPRLFPPMVVHMVAIGEKSGQTAPMFEKIADFYDDEVDRAVETLTSLIEPMLIIFLGGIVLVVLLAIYLPIFKMAGAISGGA